MTFGFSRMRLGRSCTDAGAVRDTERTAGQGFVCPRLYFDEEVHVLVLSRKRGEQIVINDNITITVVAIRGGKVRLGVEAPEDVPIHRREIARQLNNGRRQTLRRQEFERT